MNLQYSDKFDKEIIGNLKLALPPPTGLEIIIIRHVYGFVSLLVRSPEPFNDPRIEKSTDPALAGSNRLVKDGFKITSEDGQTVYNYLASKDQSQYLFPNANGIAYYNFIFNLVEFNGVTYEVDSTKSVSFRVKITNDSLLVHPDGKWLRI